MQEEDFKFFVEHYQEFFSRYGHKFLAIKNKRVLGAFDSAMDALEEITKVEPLGSFIVQECTGDESAYTVFITTPVFLN